MRIRKFKDGHAVGIVADYTVVWDTVRYVIDEVIDHAYDTALRTINIVVSISEPTIYSLEAKPGIEVLHIKLIPSDRGLVPMFFNRGGEEISEYGARTLWDSGTRSLRGINKKRRSSRKRK